MPRRLLLAEHVADEHRMRARREKREEHRDATRGRDGDGRLRDELELRQKQKAIR